MSQDALVGQTLGHYRIVEKIGAGGMGVVYRARDERLGRDVALKVLPEAVLDNEAACARFRKEALALARLSHPNIGTVFDFDTENGLDFLVMELIEGETLAAKLQVGPIAEKDIAMLGAQMASALEEAHEHGIIHRDLKPGNIVVNLKGQAKVLDFGLARLLRPGADADATASQGEAPATAGTVSYMAPEQLRGQSADARSDIWALGVVLYEMATGARPFQGETGFALSAAILRQSPPPLPSRIPAVLRAVTERCLEKEPGQRYQRAGEVRAALETLQTRATPPAPEKSIAVLYFENMSAEQEGDYFCAGITEDIIVDLSKMRDLKVIPRSDVLPFRHKEVKTRQVGETLRVNYILEGSVRKAGNKVRVTAQLIKVQDGYPTWAERFDSLVEDLFEVQKSVSEKIAEALKISLTDAEKQSLAKKPTDDLKAYDSYMRGRELLYQRGKRNTEEAIGMFQSAVNLDPGFAAAQAGLAEAYAAMFEWYDGRSFWLGQTIEMNEKALALDPGSLDARFGVALIYFYQKRLGESKRVLEEILREDKQYYPAHLRLGMIAELSAELESALQHYIHAAESKPYDEDPWRFLVGIHRKLENNQAAHTAALNVIEITSRKLEASPDDVIVMSRLAEAYALYEAKEEAHAILRRILELDPSDGLAFYNCACAHALLGEKKEALLLLRRAFDSGFRAVDRWAKADSAFALLHDEPEFSRLLAELG